MLQGTAPMDTEVMKTMLNTLLSSSFTVPSHWLHMTKTEHSKCLSFLKVYFKMICLILTSSFSFSSFRTTTFQQLGERSAASMELLKWPVENRCNKFAELERSSPCATVGFVVLSRGNAFGFGFNVATPSQKDCLVTLATERARRAMQPGSTRFDVAQRVLGSPSPRTARDRP